MTIPVGYTQVNLLFRGDANPLGSQIAFGTRNTTGAPADAIGKYVRDQVVERILPFMSEGYVLEGVRVKLGPDKTGPFAEVASGEAGKSVSRTASPAVCYLLHKQTALGGRMNRGRIYVPSVLEEAIDAAGRIIFSTMESIHRAWSGLLTALSDGGQPMVILHKTGETPTLVQHLAMSNTVATQRRRQRR